MDIFGILIFSFNKKQLRFNCTAVPLLVHVVFAATETFKVSSEKIFHFLRQEVRVPCYQQSGYSSSPLAIFFKYVATRILLQR